MTNTLILIIDFEATCCTFKSIPRNQMEIIEIGAVIANQSTYEVISEFEQFIKPVRTPVLTDFCTELTSITQHDVDAAPEFSKAINSFKEWLYQYDVSLWGSWGNYDANQLQQDCDFHRLPNPIGAKHINLKERFTKEQGLRTKPGLGGAIKKAKLELLGTHHRGIDDARNIARLLPYILGKKSIR